MVDRGRQRQSGRVAGNTRTHIESGRRFLRWSAHLTAMATTSKTIIRERAPTAVSEIQDEGVALPLRRALNFTGSAVDLTDDGETITVDITATGGGGGNSYFPGGF